MARTKDYPRSITVEHPQLGPITYPVTWYMDIHGNARAKEPIEPARNLQGEVLYADFGGGFITEREIVERHGQ